jgi:hypothetical protein
VLAPAALSGLVMAPATLLSNNGAGIVSDHGGGIIANNGGGYRLAAVATQVPVAGATVRLLDAAGQPVKGADGQPLTATTSASGAYAFASVPAGHNYVLSTDLGATGSLTAIAPLNTAKADVDLVSTLTTTYILDQYVKGQADQVKTLDKLPASVEADTRTKAAAALTVVPDALTPTKVVAAVDSLRKADATFDAQMEAVKKLLIVAGQSDLGNGLPALQVDLQDVQRLLVAKDGGLVIVASKRIWRMAPDTTLVKAFDSPNDPIRDAALDEQGRLLVLFEYPVANQRTRFVAARLEADGKRTELGTIAEDTGGRWAPSLGIVPGAAGEALVFTEVSATAPATGKLTRWSLAAGRDPAPTALPYTLMGGSVGRRADGTLLFGSGSVMNDTYALAPGATSFTKLTASQFSPMPVTSDGVGILIDTTANTISRRDADGSLHQLLKESSVLLTMGLGNVRVALGPDGTLYACLSQIGLASDRTQVYRVKGGTATPFAGRPPATSGAAATLPLHDPTSLAPAPNGAILIADGGQVLQVAADGTTAPWSGGWPPLQPGAKLRTDAAGNVYVGVEDDLKPPGSNPRADRLVRVTPTGETTTVLTLPDRWDEIGTVAVGPAGPVAVVAVHLDYVSVPHDLLFGPGVWVGLAGTPTFKAVQAPAGDAGFPFPAVAVDAAGQAYVANKVQTWKLGADGTLTPHVTAGIDTKGAFAVDARGRAYFAHATAVGAAGEGAVIDRYAPDGTHDVVAGPGGKWFSGTGVDDSLGTVMDLAFAQDGALLVLDAGHKQVKRIPPDGL